VYDARLQQDEPAYAVQKGALSVSVAPFNAISANASQMTFQVLVPSLNVFVDRKIQISAGLNFTAQLFYSGPRGPSLHGYPGNATAQDGFIAGTTLTLSGTVNINGTAAQTLPPGTLIWSNVTGASIQSGTYIVGYAGANVYVVNNPQMFGLTGTRYVINFECPLNYDVPDASTGIQQQIVQDAGFSNINQGEMFLQTGYCTAVSAKDLSLVPFPLQGALSNMTATLNDCTVTTNGDTLREQLLLTSTKENIKQRTTPTNIDLYSWGRDDALNGSGNFSSYSVVNGYGDLPNGSYPMQWFADASQQKALTGVVGVLPSISGGAPVTYNGTGTFPFLATGSQYSFGLETATGNFSGATGSSCGFYIAKQASVVAGSTSNNVIVPYVNGQPVWTTGFPGGDLVCINALGLGMSANFYSPTSAFSVVGPAAGVTQTLTLLKSVPPFCMIGARLYVMGTTASGVQPTPIAFVAGLLSGSLGAAGSTYNLCCAAALSTTSNLCLSAGFQVTNGPMPVFGSVTVVEPLVLSPLIWADSAEFQTVGLYGMTNMQFVLNFTASLGTVFAASNPAASSIVNAQLLTLPYWVDDLTKPTNNCGNIIRSSNLRTVISDLTWGSSANQYGPWTNPTLFVAFLTPGPDITLPLVSTVPYVEFPRYVKTLSGATFSGTQSLGTQTISLTSIPDMIMVYVKPATKGPSQLDQYIPIQNVSVTFDNFSNLCSGFQQFNLYESAVAAGLDMDWHQWRGFTQGALPSLARTNAQLDAVTISPKYKQTGFTQLSGGPILLRMGHDVTLSPGLAPGCLGNYSIQVQVQTSNPWGFYDYINSATITLIAINTGFFETVRGQSAIRKTILNSADVEAATPESGVTKTHLNRLVGRGSGAYMTGGSTHTGLWKSMMGRIGKHSGPSAMGIAQAAHAGMKRAHSSGLV